MIGDLVDVPASRAKLEKYSSASSKGYAGAALLSPDGNTKKHDGNTAFAGVFPDVPGPVVALASMAEICPSDVVLALLPHLPEATIRLIYERLLSEWRDAAAELADDDFDPPDGMASWSEHPLFARPVDLDWQELRDLVAASTRDAP